jgi:hypothetical protein
MGIDAVAGGDFDGYRDVSGGGTFEVDVWVRVAGSAYKSYQANINYNPSILAWDPVGGNNWNFTPTGAGIYLDTMTVITNGQARDQNPVDTTPDSTFGGGATSNPPVTDTGIAARVTFHCVANGTSYLDLWPTGSFRTMTIDEDGNEIGTALTNATINCSSVTAPPARPTSPIVSFVRLSWMMKRLLP